MSLFTEESMSYIVPVFTAWIIARFCTKANFPSDKNWIFGGKQQNIIKQQNINKKPLLSSIHFFHLDTYTLSVICVRVNITYATAVTCDVCSHVDVNTNELTSTWVRAAGEGGYCIFFFLLQYIHCQRTHGLTCGLLGYLLLITA